MSDSTPQSLGCPGGSPQGITYCLPNEEEHLQEDLPSNLIPSKPIANGYHRGHSNPQCVDGICGQRICFTTMHGHELRMMDPESSASNISLTTADASQHIRLDELNKISWYTSEKHSIIFADEGHYNAASSSGSPKYLDPNQMVSSTYQLIQTEKCQKIWLSDSEKCPRIHLHTTDGHEVLLLDHDNGNKGISPTPHKGRIQITTADKKMQIVIDSENGDIIITNQNLSGKGNKTGNISIFAENDITLDAKNKIKFTADKGFEIHSINGNWQQSAPLNANSIPPKRHTPINVRPTVLTELTIT